MVWDCFAILELGQLAIVDETMKSLVLNEMLWHDLEQAIHTHKETKQVELLWMKLQTYSQTLQCG